MNARDTDLLEKLLDTNQELKELWSKHLKYEQKLKKLNNKPYLTSEEKVEKKRLQLEKLKGKTRIEAILEQDRSR